MFSCLFEALTVLLFWLFSASGLLLVCLWVPMVTCGLTVCCYGQVLGLVNLLWVIYLLI